jgi:uncharacterized protein (DUF433 family)
VLLNEVVRFCRESMNAMEDGGIDWELLDEPMYTPADVSRIVRVPYQTVRYWALGRHSVAPLFQLPETSPPVLSFANMLECHVLNALRTRYELGVRRVRRALDILASKFHDPRRRHPLLTEDFRTNGVDLFAAEGAVNLSAGGQGTLLRLLVIHLERIQWSVPDFGPRKFYPFVYEVAPREPRIISLTPAIAAGRPVIDGTGVSTAVIASRFFARDSIGNLALEYDLSEQQIEEAIRWEGQSRTLDAQIAA